MQSSSESKTLIVVEHPLRKTNMAWQSIRIPYKLVHYQVDLINSLSVLFVLANGLSVSILNPS